MSLMYCQIIMCSSVVSLVFCLSILSIIESGELMSPTLVLELSITDFISVSFYYFGALLLSKYKFIILISSRWIDPFIIFPSFYFQSICIFESKMDPLQTTYSRIMFFIHSDSDWFYLLDCLVLSHLIYINTVGFMSDLLLYFLFYSSTLLYCFVLQ